MCSRAWPRAPGAGPFHGVLAVFFSTLALAPTGTTVHGAAASSCQRDLQTNCWTMPAGVVLKCDPQVAVCRKNCEGSIWCHMPLPHKGRCKCKCGWCAVPATIRGPRVLGSAQTRYEGWECQRDPEQTCPSEDEEEEEEEPKDDVQEEAAPAVPLGTTPFFMNSGGCCTESKSACMACKAGVSVEKFCGKNAGLFDCPATTSTTLTTRSTTKAIEFAEAGDLATTTAAYARDYAPRICCEAMTRSCLACKAGLDVDVFCSLHEGLYGCAADTMQQLPREDPYPGDSTAKIGVAAANESSHKATTSSEPPPAATTTHAEATTSRALPTTTRAIPGTTMSAKATRSSKSFPITAHAVDTAISALPTTTRVLPRTTVSGEESTPSELLSTTTTHDEATTANGLPTTSRALSKTAMRADETTTINLAAGDSFATTTIAEAFARSAPSASSVSADDGVPADSSQVVTEATTTPASSMPEQAMEDEEGLALLEGQPSAGAATLHTVTEAPADGCKHESERCPVSRCAPAPQGCQYVVRGDLVIMSDGRCCPRLCQMACQEFHNKAATSVPPIVGSLASLTDTNIDASRLYKQRQELDSGRWSGSPPLLSLAVLLVAASGTVAALARLSLSLLPRPRRDHDEEAGLIGREELSRSEGEEAGEGL